MRWWKKEGGKIERAVFWCGTNGKTWRSVGCREGHAGLRSVVKPAENTVIFVSRKIRHTD